VFAPRTIATAPRSGRGTRCPQVDGLHRVWQPFNDIAALQVVLAISIGCVPPRDGIAAKRIVERLGKFVTEHGYVRPVAVDASGHFATAPLIEPRESFYTTSNHWLRDSYVGRSGHWVDIEVAGDCSDEDLALIKRLAKAADTRLVELSRLPRYRSSSHPPH
jgi:hypothetical protein